MVYRIELSPTAIADIENIFIELRNSASVEQAEQWLQGCYDKTISLEQFPNRCPLAPESQLIGKDIRQLLYSYHKRQVYRILFTVIPSSSQIEGVVQIHRVRHSAQERLQTEADLQVDD
jgi:plasmid stabilization system protein ParE